MAFITSSREGNKPLRIFYEDMGNGPVVIFIAGWPLNHHIWEYQLTPLRERGFRCIAYDRRGFGQSDQSLDDYSYNTLADDLNALIEALDVKDIVLVGFSMGGGEIIRYLTRYGTDNVRKIVLISSVVPYLLQTDTNEQGVPGEMFDAFEASIRTDRPAFLNTFGKTFYGINIISHPVSEDMLKWTQAMALSASQKSTIECMKAFSQTDFRNELLSVNIPAMIIHGDSDKTVRIEVTGRKAAAIIPGAIMKVYKGSPHGLFITDMKKLTEDLADFIQT